MACRKPIVSTNIGGPNEIILDGETGILVRPKDSYEIAKNVLLLLRNKQLREKMELAGRKRV